MAKKEKNVKKKRTLLKIGLIILGIGLLAFGGTLLAGLVTLARDLLFTAVAVDTLLVGGALGKKAIDGIAYRISTRKSKNLQRQQTLEKIRTDDLVKNEEKQNSNTEDRDDVPDVENEEDNVPDVEKEEDNVLDGTEDEEDNEFSFGEENTEKKVNSNPKRR